jgi:predicted DNA-binding ribbon-helix-helix protein
MMETRMRAIELNGHRKGIRLDVETWAAIDWIAKNQKRKWAVWAREKINDGEDYDNLTAVIRTAAMDEILKELIKLDK